MKSPTGTFFKARLFPLFFLGLLLLPILFETLLSFRSPFRSAWELGYLLLAIGLSLGLRAQEGRLGWWAALSALAAGFSAPFCRNAWLSAALILFAVVLLCRAVVPHWAKISGGVLIGILVLCTCFRLLMGTFLGVYYGPSYEARVPGAGERYSATVTICDPGAMGRIRYHAVEQYELVSLGSAARIALVVGRDSAPSGQGAYGYLIDAYFDRSD